MVYIYHFKINMMSILSFLCLLAVSSAHLTWPEWKEQHNKIYTGDTDTYREMVWKNNVKNIELWNQENHSYTKGINKFTDRTQLELSQIYNGLKGPFPQVCHKIHPTKITQSSFGRERSLPTEIIHSNRPLPIAIDWRTEGAVTSIKDQGACGSCWAFSAIGTIEGVYATHSRSLVNLSAQQLVDCSGPEGNHGCGGGLMDLAYNTTTLRGICTEASYPYVGYDQDCNTTCLPLLKTHGCKDIISGPLTELAMQYKLTEHPISIGAYADPWFDYESGIFDDPMCNGRSNHAVVIVGYNKTGSNPYYIVKNSWGTNWGMKGYIYIAMNKNMCNITDYVSYPVL